MDDLISRKALLEAFEDYGFNQETMIPTISLMKVLEIVEEQPIAYDADKVVEQLKDCAETNQEIGSIGYGRKSISLDDVIKVVKEGAVKDE
jgi:hypothetical protein